MIVLARRASNALRRPSLWDNRDPIREELFSVERLEEHAQSLALAQTVTSPTSRGRPFALRLARNGAALLSSYRSIVQAINEGRPITSAAEWLVDNYYLIERHIRELRSDLPLGLLPATSQAGHGPFRGLSSRFRPDLGVRRSYGQQLRLQNVGPLRSRLSGRAATDHRRTLGDLDHAANRSGRESCPTCQADIAKAWQPGKRRTGWPTACSAWAAGLPNLSPRFLLRASALRSRKRWLFNSFIACAIRIRGSPRH